MALRGYFGPRAATAPARPKVKRDANGMLTGSALDEALAGIFGRPDQAELRHRRQVNLTRWYRGPEFLLSAEVEAIASEFIERMASGPEPDRCVRRVVSFVETVHTGLHELISVVGKADAEERTRHLAGDQVERRRAVSLITDLLPRPTLPEVTEGKIVTGHWASDLTALVSPELDQQVSAWLAAGLWPAAPALNGLPSRSETLDALLREHLDRPAWDLRKSLDLLDRAIEHQRRRAAEERANGAPDRRSAAEIRKELQDMGIEV